MYQKLTSQEFLSFDGTSDFIWHKQVPLKVSIMAWRLLRNRLPTKDNLVARGIISHEISCARLVVEALRLLIIYSSLAPVSVDCGVLFGRGLVSHWLIRTIYKIQFFSSFILQGACTFGVLFCSLFGYVVFGSCRMKVMIEFSRTRNAPFTNS